MAETVRTYLLDDPDSVIPMDRKEFYAEQTALSKEGKKPTRAVELISVFIVNTDGQILLQKRSYDKNHNPGLIDKAIGGHIQYEDTVHHTVMVETVQELQTPSIVLNNQKDFDKTMKVLDAYLETIAIVKHSDTKIHIFDRIINGENITLASKVHMYFGVYDGRVRPADKEAQGILFYTYDELLREMESMPDLFTQDMHRYIDLLGQELQHFIERVKK